MNWSDYEVDGQMSIFECTNDNEQFKPKKSNDWKWSFSDYPKEKNGLNVKSGIVSEGVIDAGFTGSIVAKLYNHSDTPKHFEKGDKITQIVIMPIPFIELEEVDNLGEFEASERGADGFGSSGR